MEKRLLGKTSFELSVFGLGCVTLGREIDEEKSFQILDSAIEKGINWLDTAEGYGGGNARAYRRNFLGINDVREATNIFGSSEIIIGKWLKSRGVRNKIRICTKVSSGNNPDNIRRALEVSLNRLQVDHVDIYELHSPEENVPILESLAAMADEITYGHVKSIGCSNFSLSQLKEALETSIKKGLPRFEVIQPPYSLATPAAQQDLFPFCREKKIGVTTYSPLGAGFLSGKYTSNKGFSPKGSRFDVIPSHKDIYFNKKNFKTLRSLKTLSERIRIPMVSLAMSWVLANKNITSVIIGARNISQLDNALDALNNKVDDAIIHEIDQFVTVLSHD